MTEDQVRDKVRKIVEASGDNVTEVARDFKVSPQYLHDFLRGRRGPGKSILRAVGLQKSIIYRASA